MIKFVAAAVIVIAAVAPATAQQKGATDTELLAASGRAYSGRAVETDADDSSSSSSSSKSVSKSASKSPSQPSPVSDTVGKVGNAVQAGKDVLSIFGR
jgi:hypothetical protein